MNITQEQPKRGDRPQNTKDVIEYFPLELCFTTREAIKVEKALKEAFRTDGFTYTKQKDVKTKYGQYWRFEITPYTTNFARTFYHIGILIERTVLSERKERTSLAKLVKNKRKKSL